MDEIRISALRVLSKQVGRPVKRCNHWDRNVCDFKISENYRVWKAVTGHPFLRELRFQHQGRRITLMANPEYICIRVDSKDNFPIVCSINQDEKVLFMKEANLYVGDDQRCPVFIQQSDTASDTLLALLKSSALLEVVEQFLRDRSESLHISNGRITLFSTVSSAGEVNSAIEKLSFLMDRCEALGAPRVSDFSDLPAQFHNLVPLIERWAESDDADRDALLDEASDSELMDLVSAVDPRFKQINEYLDSFEGTPTESATALGTLAECAAEAQLKLSQRNEDAAGGQ
jgi:hypothetical protein